MRSQGASPCSSRCATRNRQPAPAAEKQALIRFSRQAYAPTRTMPPQTLPSRTNSGVPGGCGTPSTLAAVMNSPASHSVTVGASVMTKPMRTRSATAAASRYGGLGGRLSHALAALEMRDGAGEEIAHLLRGEMPVQESVTCDRDRGRLFRHDEHRRVTLLRQPERRAVAGAERLVGDLELGERQYAAGADELV